MARSGATIERTRRGRSSAEARSDVAKTVRHGKTDRSSTADGVNRSSGAEAREVSCVSGPVPQVLTGTRPDAGILERAARDDRASSCGT